MRTFVHDAADAGAGKRVFQVGRGGERIHYGVREFFGKDARKACAELFARDAAGGARRISAQKFQAAGLSAAEALDLEDDAIAGIFFYAQDAAGEVALV